MVKGKGTKIFTGSENFYTKLEHEFYLFTFLQMLMTMYGTYFI